MKPTTQPNFFSRVTDYQPRGRKSWIVVGVKHWNQRTAVLALVRTDTAGGKFVQNSFCGGGSYQEVKDNLKSVCEI